MEELVNCLLRFTQLNPTQIASIESKSATVELRKGDYFSETGNVAKRVGFVTQGVLRVCWYTSRVRKPISKVVSKASPYS